MWSCKSPKSSQVPVAMFAVVGMLLTACGGDDAADTVEVTGTSACVTTDEGELSGPALTDPDWPGTTLRGQAGVCTNEMSDERTSGEQRTTVNCDFTKDGEAILGTCSGTLLITNDGGTWDGTWNGTTTWSLTAPDHVHVIDAVFDGTGDYEGLRLVERHEGVDFPWTVTGRIEPAT